MIVPADGTGSEATVCSGEGGSGDDDDVGAGEGGRGCGNWGGELAVGGGSEGGSSTGDGGGGGGCGWTSGGAAHEVTTCDGRDFLGFCSRAAFCGVAIGNGRSVSLSLWRTVCCVADCMDGRLLAPFLYELRGRSPIMRCRTQA